MRTINHICLHCTATPQTTTVESILHFWKTVNKWKMPGYHWLIKPNGHAVQLLPIEKVSNGVKGHNYDSIHISYIGGIDEHGHAKDNRTLAQKATQIELVNKYKTLFPRADVRGHRDFLTKGSANWKDCPSFEVAEWCYCAGIDHKPTTV